MPTPASANSRTAQVDRLDAVRRSTIDLHVRREMSAHVRAFVASSLDVWKVEPREEIIWVASETLATAWPLARLPYTLSVTLDGHAGVVTVQVEGRERRADRPRPAARTEREAAWSGVVQTLMGLDIIRRSKDGCIEITSVVRMVAGEFSAATPERREFSGWSDWHEVSRAPDSLAPTRVWLATSLAGALTTAALDEIQLLTSELVTNALLHAPGRVSVRYSLAPDSVCVEVRDERTDLTYTRPSMAAADAPSGRGLTLVHELSSDAGVSIGDRWKTSWFEYTLRDPKPAVG